MVTEKIIQRVENAVLWERSAEDIRNMLMVEEGLSEWDAYLAYRAGQVSVKMFAVEYKENGT